MMGTYAGELKLFNAETSEVGVTVVTCMRRWRRVAVAMQVLGAVGI